MHLSIGIYECMNANEHVLGMNANIQLLNGCHKIFLVYDPTQIWGASARPNTRIMEGVEKRHYVYTDSIPYHTVQNMHIKEELAAQSQSQKKNSLSRGLQGLRARTSCTPPDLATTKFRISTVIDRRCPHAPSSVGQRRSGYSHRACGVDASPGSRLRVHTGTPGRLHGRNTVCDALGSGSRVYLGHVGQRLQVDGVECGSSGYARCVYVSAVVYERRSDVVVCRSRDGVDWFGVGASLSAERQNTHAVLALHVCISTCAICTLETCYMYAVREGISEHSQPC